ncbi:MAG: zinc ribbon domain-containing protein [Desulfobacterales bacterium]|jgi:putative FmdB family regulatory protein
MPIFEFKCQDCQRVFEELVLRDDDPPARCPACGRGDICRVLSSGSFRPHGIAKGSGGFKPPACLSGSRK